MASPEFDILLHGSIGVDYILELDGSPLPGELRAIEGEVRQAGGEAVICARLLAAWGARIALFGNPIGDDSNGRAVQRDLETIPNLQLFAPLLAGYETPYRVILRSAHAAPALLARASENGDEALRRNGQEPVALPTARLAVAGAGQSLRALEFARACGSTGIKLVCGPLPASVTPLGAELASLSEIVLREDAWAGDEDVVSQDVFRAGLIWGLYKDWDWQRALRFAAAARDFQHRYPQDLPSVGQIEAALSAGD